MCIFAANRLTPRLIMNSVVCRLRHCMPACLRSLSVPILLLLSAVPSWGQVPRIDLLIAYTDAVEAYRGGTAGVEAHVNALVAGANLALEDSGIEGVFRVVHLHRVAYTESAVSLNDDLTRMWNGADGIMDELAGLREQHGADLIVLLRKGAANGAAGSGYVLRNETGRDDVAYSVVATEFASSSFVHEIGHNLGAHHARGESFNGVPSWGGLHSWSNGYRFSGSDGQLYRTIMAYSPGFQLMRFSNPDLTYAGAATGRPFMAEDSADNSLTLSQLFGIVENYRTELAEPGEPEGVISVDPVSFSVSDYRESYTITVQADAAWSVSGVPEWVSVSRQNSNGHNATLTVSVQPYDGVSGVFGPRSAEILIGAQVHTVTQESIVPQVVLDQTAHTIGAIGGAYWLEISANFRWRAAVMSGDWASLGNEARPEAFGAGEHVSLRVVVTENFDQAPRSLSIQVHDQVHTLTQEGATPPPSGDGDEALVSQLEMGTVAFARYDGISGRTLSDLYAAPLFPDYPDSVEVFSAFEFAGGGDNFGVRAWAWLVPEVTAEYTFWIASDDQGSLSLSLDGQPAQAEVIASVPSNTPVRRYDVFGSQQSVPVTLQAGRAYYLEAHMKQGWSGVNLSVAWSRPGVARQVIPGHVLGLIPEETEDEEPPAHSEDPSIIPTGTARLAFYENISGKTLDLLYDHAKFPQSPDRIEELPKFSHRGTGDNFGMFAWAWILPPETGYYTFWLASDDQGELLLSDSAAAEDATVIASVASHTRVESFDQYASQVSEPVYLEAGKPYYLAASVKQGWSSVHLSVAWKGPGFAREVIPSTALVAVDPPAESPALETGALAVARYDNVFGKTLADLDASPLFPAHPSEVSILNAFEYPGTGSNFGLLAWAWLIPEESGYHRFWLASDDQGALRLSPNHEPSAAVTIATVATHTNPRQYDQTPAQRSAEIWLEAGEAYYLEARVQQGWGGNNLSVAWRGPSFARQVIPGRVLGLPAGAPVVPSDR